LTAKLLLLCPSTEEVRRSKAIGDAPSAPAARKLADASDGSGSCLLWVKSGHRRKSGQYPLCPQKRISEPARVSPSTQQLCVAAGFGDLAMFAAIRSA
jgi:hypothetical protein